MQRRPCVLLVSEGLEPKASGIGRVARLMARVLSEHASAGALEARAFSLNDQTAQRDLGIPCHAFRGARAPFVAATQLAALGYTHFLYDFAGMARAHPIWMRPERPALTWMHGVEAWEHAHASRLNALRRTSCLVVNTQYTLQRARRLHGGFTHGQVCWLGTEPGAEPEALSTPSGPPTALILARIDLDGYKGHRELIEAWPRVRAAVPSARLVIAGAGPGLAQVRGWVAASPARDAIDVLGHVPQAELRTLWRRASLLAMPARGEGFGLTYIEAMRQGLPVVASVHDAAVEVNLHGVTGYNVDLEVEGELAARLAELLADPQRARALGEAGRARWATHFSYEAFRDRFAPILDGFLRVT
jgi:phosphatidyl-myo-inositol dimannoside synthase